MTTERSGSIREILLDTYPDLLSDKANPVWPLPEGLERGSDPHLAYLTLVYTISGGRDPVPLWEAARQTYAADPQLFDPQFLAYARPADLVARLSAYGLTQKPKSEATVWQRIGQALVMRARGSVQKLLAGHDYDAHRLLAMLNKSKTTFPVLSGSQMAPRWLYGLASVGAQPLTGADQLLVPASPAVKRALQTLSIDVDEVTADVFDALDTLGRRG